ncbi:tannase/feruloyl esterase family alpha/beta hydrolase [Pseudonocardia sp.]|uniref:alpha/beta hydrolase family protein n=1 Tax=Pseudonocardia sp. TaxID=60912 RepID=UPI0031FC728B
MRRSIALVMTSATAVSTVLGALALPAPAEATEQASAGPSACRGMQQLTVSGAERLEAACLSDLTTAGTIKTGHTDPSDFAGLSVPGTVNPSGVPGIQLDGYFPDTSAFNTAHGWNHDAQFVIRLPRHWNGGLVVAGPPGVRRQYASDFTISDWVLAQGYAYASTDKGNSGPMLYTDGEKPGDAIAEWHSRVTELTIAAKDVLSQRYHREPRRTYIAGFSAAGYLTRWQLENRPDLYDGGIAWSGLLMTPERNLLSYLPTALRHYPQYAANGSQAAHQALLDAGFPSGSEPIWEYSYRFFWDPLQRILREELDPTYDGDVVAGHPFCAPGTVDCDADYDLAARPSEIKDAIARISLTGRIGKPLLTLQGTLDTAVTPRDSRLYATMIENQGRGAMARLYEVEGGSHFEALYGQHPGLLRPMLPCFREAFGALEQWTENGKTPPTSRFVPRDPAVDLVNTCDL